MTNLSPQVKFFPFNTDITDTLFELGYVPDDNAIEKLSVQMKKGNSIFSDTVKSIGAVKLLQYSPNLKITSYFILYNANPSYRK